MAAPVPDGALFGLGNPLLDMQATVDADYLRRHGLKADDQILAEEKHAPIFTELSERADTEYVPGGATLNVMRVAQWLIGRPRATTFMGCVGKDRYADILKEKAEQAGVTMKLQVTTAIKTGTCAVLITGNHRSLVADLAAANKFTESHLSEPANAALLSAADLYYCAAFPLTVCPPAVMRVAAAAHRRSKPFAMNLSAPFLCEFFKEPLCAALAMADYVFGNETEAAAFARAQQLDARSSAEIALAIAAWPRGDGSTRPRTVVITQGADPVVVARNGTATEYPVEPLPASSIVDSNGAGDAFVAGYLAAMVRTDGAVDSCVRCAMWMARHVMQRTGCSHPPVCDYQF